LTPGCDVVGTTVVDVDVVSVDAVVVNFDDECGILCRM
jgi:hypothetical protein